jgi:hypothetical protein
VEKWLAETRNLSYREFRALDWEPIQANIFKGLSAQNLAKYASRYFVEATLDQWTSAPSAHKIDLRFRSVVVLALATVRAVVIGIVDVREGGGF